MKNKLQFIFYTTVSITALVLILYLVPMLILLFGGGPLIINLVNTIPLLLYLYIWRISIVVSVVLFFLGIGGYLILQIHQSNKSENIANNIKTLEKTFLTWKICLIVVTIIITSIYLSKSILKSMLFKAIFKSVIN